MKCAWILGDNDKEAISVKIDNCNDEYCEVKRSTPAKLEITFAPDTDSTELTSAIHAQIAGQWIPWPLGPQSKVCANLSKGKCPLAANTEATYVVNIKIPIIAPIGTRTVVQVRISDQNKGVAACTRFPVKVVA